MTSAHQGIRVEGLGKRFNGRVAVEGLTFEVQPGEVFGLLGPNGAGKTTTVRMLTGLLTPSEGTGEVCGVKLPLVDEGSDLRKAVGLLTEQPGLYDRLSARENLKFFTQIHELNPVDAWKRALGYLERFGLAERVDEPVGGFSKGMRQKLAIVRTVLHSPQVVFLDEPTSGLDPQSARTVRDAIAELANEGRTMVLCSHNLAEVERLCTRVAVIKNRLRTVASLKDLRKAGGALEITLTSDAKAFIATVAQGEVSATAEGALLKVLMPSAERAPEVVTQLVNAGAKILAVTPVQRPLEEAYLEFVNDGVTDEA